MIEKGRKIKKEKIKNFDSKLNEIAYDERENENSNIYHIKEFWNYRRLISIDTFITEFGKVKENPEFSFLNQFVENRNSLILIKEMTGIIKLKNRLQKQFENKVFKHSVRKQQLISLMTHSISKSKMILKIIKTKLIHIFSYIKVILKSSYQVFKMFGFKQKKE